MAGIEHPVEIPTREDITADVGAFVMKCQRLATFVWNQEPPPASYYGQQWRDELQAALDEVYALGFAAGVKGAQDPENWPEWRRNEAVTRFAPALDVAV